MKIFAEREAENFLKKAGFRVIETFFIRKKTEIEKAAERIGFPLVMKVSGKKILHKNELGGVKVGIKSYEQAAKTFDLLKRIKGSDGVLVQRKIHGQELLLGIKKTPEFGHVIAFGIGGTDVERIKKVSFRVCPLEEKEVLSMINEIKINLKKEDTNSIVKNIIKLCALVKKYPRIKELDINPLIVEKNKALIVDARIIFD